MVGRGGRHRQHLCQGAHLGLKSSGSSRSTAQGAGGSRNGINCWPPPTSSPGSQRGGTARDCRTPEFPASRESIFLIAELDLTSAFFSLSAAIKSPYVTIRPQANKAKHVVSISARISVTRSAWRSRCLISMAPPVKTVAMTNGIARSADIPVPSGILNGRGRDVVLRVLRRLRLTSGVEARNDLPEVRTLTPVHS